MVIVVFGLEKDQVDQTHLRFQPGMKCASGKLIGSQTIKRSMICIRGDEKQSK